VDGFCAACADQDNINLWAGERRNGLLAGVVILFLITVTPYLLLPLFPGAGSALRDTISGGWTQQRWSEAAPATAKKDVLRGHSIRLKLDAAAAAGPPPPSRLAAYVAIVAFFAEPASMLVEQLQIISSFKRTMNVPWPDLFRSTMGRLNFVNFNFLHLPSSACAMPQSDFYGEFVGILVGVSAFLCFIAAVWLAGLALARWRQLPASLVASFSRTTLQRVLFLLEIAYTPLAETSLAMLSCRRIGSASWLSIETELQCGTPRHDAYARGAAFFIALYVVGIPILFVVLMYYYRVPQAARHLRRLAELRTVVDLAFQRGLEMPGVNTSALTLENISEVHVEAIYRKLLHHHAGNCNARLQSSEKLEAIMEWAHASIVVSHYSWRDIQPENDLRREGAEEAVGCLFEAFLPVRWYFKVVETLIKLLLSSVLLFIVPGSPAQIVAGMFISGCYLLLYLRTLPYAFKPIRRIAYAGNVSVFVFFIIALMLKMRVPIGHWSDIPPVFYTAVVAILIYGFLFWLPLLIIWRSGLMQQSLEYLSYRSHAKEHGDLSSLSGTDMDNSPEALEVETHQV
jgi:hypothetical protein